MRGLAVFLEPRWDLLFAHQFEKKGPFVHRARLFAFVFLCWLPTAAQAENSDAAERGYRFLTEKSYLPPDFNEIAFDQVWKTWPPRLRAAAERASLAERREMAFERYGLTPRPHDDTGRPLQYVVDNAGNWTMNCFSCHGGSVDGQVIPGLPNANFELETLTEELRLAKLLSKQPLTRMDVGSLVMPLGTTRGLTNAVMFGVALMSYRDEELNVFPDRHPTRMVHHDMDPPPWWHFRKKRQLYIDGFAEKGARGLMQFMLIKENGPQKFREWEGDFEDVFAYLQSLRPPEYPHAIQMNLAEKGRALFETHCSTCHGTYGDQWEYPERMVPIDEIGTDPVRLTALTAADRSDYGASWFAHYGDHHTVAEPAGYVAPPLDGIWASAPYFHNGSAPTLWDVLHPGERPPVWKRTGKPYDRERLGLAVERLTEMPRSRMSKRLRRQFYDSSEFGKSRYGHDFPDALSESEKRSVLEYLKTL